MVFLSLYSASDASGKMCIIPIARNKPPAKQFEKESKFGFVLKVGTMRGIHPKTNVIESINMPPKNYIISKSISLLVYF